MKRKYSVVKNELSIQVKNIAGLFTWFYDDNFIVNRRYQRKLVWTLQEKQSLIDTIVKGYSIPMFLLAVQLESVDKKYEIIDGLQRLDAIFSFIKGDYMYDDGNGVCGYFDLTALPKTNVLLRNGKLRQRNPVLPVDLCSEFVAYELALSITEADESHVEETFRRVNSGGRQLSSQDLRQAGIDNVVSELVRRISIRIRRDSSNTDKLALSMMHNISISDAGLNYGIRISDIFWVRHGIITKANIRASRDEELVAHLLARMVCGASVGASADTLNNLYNERSTVYKKFKERAESMGVEEIESRFMSVMSFIEEMFEFPRRNFSSSLFENKDVSGKRKIFIVLYTAVYEFIYEDNMKLCNKQGLLKELKKACSEILAFNHGDSWNSRIREQKLSAVKERMLPYFEKSKNAALSINTDIEGLENLLSSFSIEEQMFECKVGFYDFQTGQFNEKNFHKIMKTLTAMANTKFGEEGCVVVGIADKASDASKVEKLYDIKAAEYRNFHITGVDGEANKHYRSFDEYFRKLTSLIENEPIMPDDKSYICRHVKPMLYKGHNVVVFCLKATSGIATYDGKFYERHGNEIREVLAGTPEFNGLLKRFSDFQAGTNK